MVAVQNRALGGFARTLWARSLASTGPAASTGRLAPDQIRLAKPDITIAPAPNPRELPRFRPRSLDRGLFSPTDSAEDPQIEQYAPHPSGTKFLFLEPAGDEKNLSLGVLLNWPSLVPGGR